MAFAWLVWDANHTGPTVLDRISWKAPGSGSNNTTTPPTPVIPAELGKSFQGLLHKRDHPLGLSHSPLNITAGLSDQTFRLSRQRLDPRTRLYRDYETRAPSIWPGLAHGNTPRIRPPKCCVVPSRLTTSRAQIWIPGNPIPAHSSKRRAAPSWLIVAHNAPIRTGDRRAASASPLRLAAGSARAAALHHGRGTRAQLAGEPGEARRKRCS